MPFNKNPLELYKGFYITEPVGNNAFSFSKRTHKKLFVPPVASGTPADLAIGDEYVFCEVEDGIEKCFYGLEKFIHFNYKGREVVIFDNHNHAFFFWCYARQKDLFKNGEKLVHVDQHTDMRQPETWLSPDAFANAEEAFDYTQHNLNVGNFIQPALEIGVFSEVDIIDSSSAFQNSYNEPFVLDIDIDIFSEDMRYIDDDFKTARIKELIGRALFITVATSPFFIDQNRAIEQIRKLFS